MPIPGKYAERCLALDLGTSTVRLWTPAIGTAITAPTVLARLEGDRFVAGQAALALPAHEGSVTWPVRGGVVRDFFACVQMLRLLVADLGLPSDPTLRVLAGVPATATPRQRTMLVAAARQGVGGRVTAVEEPLAAALACRPDAADTNADLVVVDIGSGRTEVARIADGIVVAAHHVNETGLVDRIPAIADCVRRLHRPRGRRHRLLLTGGGAMTPGIAAQLAALTGRSVTMPADPSLATLTGLRLLLTG
ncbi:rod shape-determining protein [Dactylosporangium sp. NPDC049742]|uniref:rod shape-determining protein n=1 Tax=Dactylosporangium sp. NPDC049742 TaxID=3154737 RepID=UPI0034336503